MATAYTPRSPLHLGGALVARRWAGSVVRRLRWWIGGLVLVAALAGGGGYLYLRTQSVPAAELIAARMQGARWFEGRSTIGLPWAPYVAHAPIERPNELLGALYVQADHYDAAAMALFLQWREEPGDLKRAKRELAGLPVSAARWNEQALLFMSLGKDVEGLDAVEQGLLLEPQRVELLFTRAVLLERLYLYNQAIEGWERYLAVDREGKWAKEARARQARAQEIAARREKNDDPTEQVGARFRSIKSQQELQRFLADPESQRTLALLDSEGNHFYRHEIAYLERLDAGGWEGRVAAVERYDADYKRTIASTIDHADLDAGTRSEEPLLALIYLRLAAFDAIQRTEKQRALALLERIEAMCVRLTCTTERILAKSDLGTVLNRAGDFQGAERAFDEALRQLPPRALLRRAELLGKQTARASLTGAIDQVERLGREGLRIARETGYSGPAALLANVLGRGAAAQDFERAALDHYQEALALARAAGFARLEQRALSSLAERYIETGDESEAEALLQTALARANKTGIPSSRFMAHRTLAELRLRQGRNEEAVQHLDEALRSGGAVADDTPLLLAARATALRRGGDLASALRALEAAVGAADDLERAANDRLEAVRLEAEFGTFRGRLAALRAEREPSTSAWVDLSRKEPRALSRGECLLAQAELDDGLGRWIGTDSGTHFVQAGKTSPVFGSEGCPTETTRLTLLETAALPANELARRARVERPDVAVVIARDPSLPWPERVVGGPALAIHDPFPIDEDKTYPRLPNARVEAELLISLFQNSSELAGRSATPAGLEKRVADASIVHFGVHGEAREGSGAASYLLLAGPAGRLQVADILELPLSRHPLVVLSACRGAGRSTDRERDGTGLPWAFLEAGASAVVATQDDLDDAVALRFSEVFYRSLAAGSGISSAFETALATLRKEWSPEVAAAFSLYI